MEHTTIVPTIPSGTGLWHLYTCRKMSSATSNGQQCLECETLSIIMANFVITVELGYNIIEGTE
jgi:hypothetical protein